MIHRYKEFQTVLHCSDSRFFLVVVHLLLQVPLLWLFALRNIPVLGLPLPHLSCFRVSLSITAPTTRFSFLHPLSKIGSLLSARRFSAFFYAPPLVFSLGLITYHRSVFTVFACRKWYSCTSLLGHRKFSLASTQVFAVFPFGVTFFCVVSSFACYFALLASALAFLF